ncbi:MAG TPA: hypothetical protein VFQ45_20385 [Longimicrobium sp.]|nr:hypothetical protein [Longimicrobium sp.]
MLSAEERERLFTHGMHEEGVFYHRLNFFLLCESLLLASVVSGVSGDKPLSPTVVTGICGLGVLVSLFWWFAQIDKLRLVKILEKRIAEALPEFAETIYLLESRHSQWSAIRGWSANTALAYFFPPLFISAWVGLALVAWL